MNGKIFFLLVMVASGVLGFVDTVLWASFFLIPGWVWAAHLLIYILVGGMLWCARKISLSSHDNDHLFADYKQEKGGTKWG